MTSSGTERESEREMFCELRLTSSGPGSRKEITDYVRTVLEQRTTVDSDTSADQLADGIIMSVLVRLGATYSIVVDGFSGREIAVIDGVASE